MNNKDIKVAINRLEMNNKSLKSMHEYDKADRVLIEKIMANELSIILLKKELNGGWIPLEIEYDEEYKMDRLQGELPDDEQEIFVSDGESSWYDTFMRDGTECYLDSGADLIALVKAWQPLPKPYKAEV